MSFHCHPSPGDNTNQVPINTGFGTFTTLTQTRSMTDIKQVTACALQDWLQARRLDLQMQKLLKAPTPTSVSNGSVPASDDNIVDKNDPSIQTRTNNLPNSQLHEISWTRVHSHFVLMGGIAIYFNKAPINLLPIYASGTRLLLTRQESKNSLSMSPHCSTISLLNG